MTKSKDLSPELHYVGEIASHAVYEVIPSKPLEGRDKLGVAASRRCFDPRALRDIISEEPTTETPEEPPVNELEAMARLYGKYGVTAATMASAPIPNEIYTIPMDKSIYNE
jgi:hypothetical protein